MSPEFEPKAWSLSNIILTAMGVIVSALLGLIVTLLILGFNAQNLKIDSGNALLLQQVTKLEAELKNQHEKFGNLITDIIKDVATLKARQQDRLDKEKIKAELDARSGKR